MQLDAVLRSLFLHCQDANQIRLLVIYKTTSDFHTQQYSQLAREYPEVDFVEQTHFRRNVLELLTTYGTQRPVGILRRWLIGLGPGFGLINNMSLALRPQQDVLFLVDDNLFVRSFNMHDVHEALLAHPEALGFSLRLGTNTTYCYPVDKAQTLPPFTPLYNGIMEYNWVDAGDLGHDFGYPLEVSSSVYRVNELLPFMNSLPFENPNTLEGRMAARAHAFRSSNPYLLCYERSAAFCSPVNMVQEVSANRVGATPEYSTEHLAKMYNAGYRIKVEAYGDFVPNACHQEVQLVLEKRRPMLKQST